MDPTTEAAGKTAGAGTTPPDGTGTATPPANAGATNGKTFTQDELNSMLAKERKDTEARLKDEANKAKLQADGETQKLLDLEKQRAATLEASLRATRVEAAAATAAAKLGIRSERLPYAMQLLGGAGTVEYDADGKPTNVEALLAKVLKDLPELAGTTPTPSAGGGTNAAKGQPLTRELIERMSPAELEARMPEIRAFLAKQ